MPKQMTGAEAVIAQLAAEGVDLVLSIPGIHNMYICDAVLDYPQMQFVTGRHEQEITFISNGYNRASGKVSVPLVISGPGVTNSLTPLADAYLDTVPMVLIAAQADTRYLGTGVFHELKDQTGLLGSITKWNTRVSSVAEIPDAVRTAFTQALSGRPGPTAVEVPVNIQVERGEADIYPSTRPTRPEADPVAVQELARRLRAATAPLLILGTGAVISDCGAELTRLIDLLQIPFDTTPAAKGLVPEDHPLSLGSGWTLRGPARPFLEEADLVLVIGSSLDEASTGLWSMPLPANLAQIDIIPAVIGRRYPVAVPVVGDAKKALIQLLEALGPAPVARPALAGRIAAMKTETQDSLRSSPAWQYMQAVQSALPSDAFVTNDAARANGWALFHLKRFLPRTMNITSNLGSLGYAWPAAIGASLAYPDRQAVAIMGDGGFLFSEYALATAVQHGLNTVALVFNDASYSSIKRYQERIFGRVIGTDLRNPDFVKLAEAYGAVGVRAHQPEQLYDALMAAWQRQLPTLIEVPLDVDGKMF